MKLDGEIAHAFRALWRAVQAAERAWAETSQKGGLTVYEAAACAERDADTGFQFASQHCTNAH